MLTWEEAKESGWPGATARGAANTAREAEPAALAASAVGKTETRYCLDLRDGTLEAEKIRVKEGVAEDGEVEPAANVGKMLAETGDREPSAATACTDA